MREVRAGPARAFTGLPTEAAAPQRRCSLSLDCSATLHVPRPCPPWVWARLASADRHCEAQWPLTLCHAPSPFPVCGAALFGGASRWQHCACLVLAKSSSCACSAAASCSLQELQSCSMVIEAFVHCAGEARHCCSARRPVCVDLRAFPALLHRAKIPSHRSRCRQCFV